MYTTANAPMAYAPHTLHANRMGMGTNQALMLLKTLHTALSHVFNAMDFNVDSFPSWPCGSGDGGHHGGHGHGHHGGCTPDEPATLGRWRLDMLGCDVDVNGDGLADYIELYEDGSAKLKTVGPDGCVKTQDDYELDAEMYADDLEHLPPFLQEALGLEDDDHNCPHHCYDQGGWGWFPDMPMHGYGQGYGYPGMGGAPSTNTGFPEISNSLFSSVIGTTLGTGFNTGYGSGYPLGYDYNMTGGIFNNRRGTDYNIHTWPSRDVIDHARQHAQYAHYHHPINMWGMPMGW